MSIFTRISEEPPFRLMTYFLVKRFSSSIRSKNRWAAVDRPQYLAGVLAAADLARASAIPEISVIEFGVAGGSGLVALESYAKAVEAEPFNGAYLDSLGWVLYRMDQFEEAERYLRQALERVNRDPTIHDHLGDVYVRLGRLKDAILHWEKSLVEWQAAAPSDSDPAEIAKIQKKLEGAKVRLAKESSSAKTQKQ